MRLIERGGESAVGGGASPIQAADRNNAVDVGWAFVFEVGGHGDAAVGATPGCRLAACFNASSWWGYGEEGLADEELTASGS